MFGTGVKELRDLIVLRKESARVGDPPHIIFLASTAEILSAIAWFLMGAFWLLIDRNISTTGWLIGLALAGFAAAWIIRIFVKRKTPRPPPKLSLQATINQLDYRIISEAQVDAAHDHRVPALSAELVGLGFTSVGVLDIRGPEADSDAVEIIEILASPDHTTFALPEVFFASQTLALRTIFADGRIVETSVFHAPRAASRLGTWIRRWRAARRWPRKNRPGALYIVRLYHNVAADKLWQLHRDQIASYQARGGTIPPHTSADLAIALSRQALEIAILGAQADLVTVPTLGLVPIFMLLGVGWSVDAPRATWVLLPLLVLLVMPAVLRVGRRMSLPMLRTLGRWVSWIGQWG
jgi:hypothetical protein